MRLIGIDGGNVMVGNGLFVFVGGCLFVLNCIEIEIMMCVLLG